MDVRYIKIWSDAVNGWALILKLIASSLKLNCRRAPANFNSLVQFNVHENVVLKFSIVIKHNKRILSTVNNTLIIYYLTVRGISRLVRFTIIIIGICIINIAIKMPHNAIKFFIYKCYDVLYIYHNYCRYY